MECEKIKRTNKRFNAASSPLRVVSEVNVLPFDSEKSQMYFSFFIHPSSRLGLLGFAVKWFFVFLFIGLIESQIMTQFSVGQFQSAA